VTSTGTPTGGSLRRAWIAIGVVLLIAVPGALALAWESNTTTGVPSAPVPIIVGLAGTPIYSTSVCTVDSPEVFETFFQVASLTSALRTSEFTLSLTTAAGVPISPNGSAPPPTADLPCSGPHPSGWYVFLSQATAGAIATYPAPGPGGVGLVWTNATSAPANVTPNDQFVFVTVADFTGTGDKIAAQGIGGATVELAGDVTFPPYQNP
jgi:hypothetical protein